jgi:DhnA family fructose-bisphosphate aldolase class Ia
MTPRAREIRIWYGADFDEDKLLDEIRSIRAGGGFGSIIGRNSFQRPKEGALRMLCAIMDVRGSHYPSARRALA